MAVLHSENGLDLSQPSGHCPRLRPENFHETQEHTRPKGRMLPESPQSR